MEYQIIRKAEAFDRKTSFVAAQLSAHLKNLRLSQRDFARMLGKEESYVSRILAGRMNLTLRTITELETALGKPLLETPDRFDDLPAPPTERTQEQEIEDRRKAGLLFLPRHILA